MLDEGGTTVRMHVICVGTEILRGHTLNTNLAYLGAALEEHGFRLDRELCVPDVRPVIAAALLNACRDAEFVLTIGGLGPTSDDVTRDAVAEAMGLRLVLDPDLLSEIQAYLAERQVRLPAEALRVQVEVVHAFDQRIFGDSMAAVEFDNRPGGLDL